MPATAQFTQQGPPILGGAGVTLGWSVAVSSDGSTAVVGAPLDSGSVGAAFVYVRSGGTWVQQDKLVGASPIGASLQGYGVAISADGNRVAVGGPGDNTDVGAVWVFDRVAGAWGAGGTKILPTDPNGASQYGTSVSLSANGNTLAVGGPGDAALFGALWVVQRSAGVWTQLGPKLEGPDNSAASLGISVAISGDGNTILGGGNIQLASRGAFWFFVRGAPNFEPQGGRHLFPLDISKVELGTSVALSNDGDTAVIGAIKRGAAGAALVYVRSEGTWSQQAELVPNNATAGALFGSSASLSSDGNLVVIGALNDSAGLGATWVFTRSGLIWTQGSKLVGTGGTAGANQGVSAAVSADRSVVVIGGYFNNGFDGAVWFWGGGPDPTVVKAHTGNFNQGESQATYTLTVSNVGAQPTVGTITVIEVPPFKMIAQSMSGLGWTCSMPTQTCSRADVLNPGESFPTITVKVIIATDAPPTLTNTAFVFGGGDINISNNVGTDLTVINPRPDLSTTVTHSGAFVQGTTNAGQYIVTYANVGTVASTQSNVNFTLAPGQTVQSITPPAGANTSQSTSGFSGTIPALNPGSTAIFRVNINLASNAPPTVSGTGTISGGDDYNAINNSDTEPANVNATAGLSITKTHSGVFKQGDTNRVYTITVTNATASAVLGATVTDILPADLTATAIGGTGWDCILATLVCTRTDALAAGKSFPVISVYVTVSATAPNSVTNEASVTGGATATDVTSIQSAPDLRITKTHTGNFSEGAQNLSYTIAVKNWGGSPTSGLVTVVDTLPAGIIATSMSGNNWTCTLATTTCTRSDALAAGWSYAPITLGVRIAADAVSGSNTVTVSGGGELNNENNTAVDATTVTLRPDLTVNSVHTGAFTPGQTGTYELTVSNIGGAVTSGVVTITDTLPFGLTATSMGGDGWNCLLATLTCTRSTPLAGQDSYPTIFLDVNVSASISPNVTLTNRATVSGGGETNNANNTVFDATTTGSTSDMTISGNTGTPTFTGGQTDAYYNLVAVNTGAASTNGSAVTMQITSLPVGLTATGLTSAAGWTCNLAALRCTTNNQLPPGAPQGFTLNVTVAANAPAVVTLKLSVAGGGEADTTNNNATISTGVTLSADLVVIKNHFGNFLAGQPGATYRITITNRGGAPTSGPVTVTDVLPPGLLNPVISGDGWTPGTNTTSRADALAPGASYPPAIVTVDVSPTASGSVTNSVVVSNTGRDYPATDPTNINPTPDLTISKSATNGPFTQGQTNATYTLTVTNSGNGAVPAGNTVTVREFPPAGLTITSLSGAGWYCTVALLYCTRADALAIGALYPAITVIATVGGSATSPLTNTATVAGGGEIKTDNNTSSIQTNVNGQADLQITKFHTGNFTQGQNNATYTIRVRNIGAVASTGAGTVTVVDTLPASLTRVSITGAAWNCVLVTLTCTNTAALQPGVDNDITLTVNVPLSAPASVTNVATVSGGGDVNAANNSASDLTLINGVPDLIVSKTHTGNFYRGQFGAIYTIVVTNIGAGAVSAGEAGKVTVIDTLPPNLTVSLMSGLGWSCAGTTCERQDGLAANGSYPPITLRVDINNSADPSVTNTVQVSGGGQVNTTNDTAADQTFISAGPDLIISKTHTVPSVAPGGSISYSLTVRNIGTAATDGGQVSLEELPPGTLTLTGMSGSGWSCNYPATPYTCVRTVGTQLPAGASYPSVTVTATVSGGASGTIVNTATVFPNGGDTVLTNNTTTDSVPVVAGGQPNLTVISTHVGTWGKGTQQNYTVTVGNIGSGPTLGTVTLVDTIPAGLTMQSISGLGWSCVFQTKTCTRSDVLTSGSSYPPITVRVLVQSTAPPTVTNTVTVSGGGDTTPADNTFNDVTTIL